MSTPASPRSVCFCRGPATRRSISSVRSASQRASAATSTALMIAALRSAPSATRTRLCTVSPRADVRRTSSTRRGHLRSDAIYSASRWITRSMNVAISTAMRSSFSLVRSSLTSSTVGWHEQLHNHAHQVAGEDRAGDWHHATMVRFLERLLVRLELRHARLSAACALGERFVIFVSQAQGSLSDCARCTLPVLVVPFMPPSFSAPSPRRSSLPASPGRDTASNCCQPSAPVPSCSAGDR